MWHLIGNFLAKIKISNPLVVLIVFLGNFILFVYLVFNQYPQIIQFILRGSNYNMTLGFGVLLVVVSVFFGAVELYFGNGVIKWADDRRRWEEIQELFHDLSPVHKEILRTVFKDQVFPFGGHDPIILAGLLYLENQGLIYRLRQPGPETYVIDERVAALLRKKPALLDLLRHK